MEQENKTKYKTIPIYSYGQLIKIIKVPEDLAKDFITIQFSSGKSETFIKI